MKKGIKRSLPSVLNNYYLLCTKEIAQINKTFMPVGLNSSIFIEATITGGNDIHASVHWQQNA